MVRDKPLRASWERKLKERQERRQVRELARQLQEGKQRQREVTGLRGGADNETSWEQGTPALLEV